MLVSEPTFEGMWAEAQWTHAASVALRIPSLRHLLALKLHALKQAPRHRRLKDMNDVLQLVESNAMDVSAVDFRGLCLRYGDRAVYEQILQASRS